MRKVLYKIFNNAELILAFVAIFSLSFNVYLFMKQNKQTEETALAVEEKYYQLSKAMQDFSIKKSMSANLHGDIIDLKFLNYELFSLCADKKRYSPSEFKSNLRRINTQRFRAIRELVKSSQGKSIFVPLFKEKTYADIQCRTKWNIALYEKVHSTDQCQIIQVSDISFCKENKTKYADFCMIKDKQKLTLQNFDKLFDQWHQCQSFELNQQVKQAEIKIDQLLSEDTTTNNGKISIKLLPGMNTF